MFLFPGLQVCTFSTGGNFLPASSLPKLRKCIAPINDHIDAGHVRASIRSQEHISLRQTGQSVLSRHVSSQVKHTLFNSAASQMRPPGIIDIHFSNLSLGCFVIISVMMKPGDTELTRAKSAHSTARPLARCTAAALDALYATCVWGTLMSVALTDAVTIRFPFPCLWKIRPAACAVHTLGNEGQYLSISLRRGQGGPKIEN